MKRIRISIFVRLLLVFVIGGFLINQILFSTFKPPRPSLPNSQRSHPERPNPKELRRQANRLVEELRNSPTLDRANRIKKDTGLEILFEGTQTSWSTMPFPPNLGHLTESSLRFQDDPSVSVGPGFVTKKTETGTFAILFPRGWIPNPLQDPKLMWMIILRVSVIVILCYLFVLWQLRPIRWFQRAAQTIGEGKLDHKVPVKHSNEFGELATRFNEMTDRLRTMVQAKDELLANISHELRSPLTRIRLAMELDDEEKRKSRVTEDVQEMEKMIEEILESFRLQSQHGSIRLIKTDIETLVRDIALKYADRKPGVICKNFSNKKMVPLDPDKMRTVLGNLIENALKYSPPSASPVEISAHEVKENVQILIKDQGTGIPKEDREKIFEPFYRVDSSRRRQTGGAGLGLSLCKKIVEAHGGTIEVQDGESSGTTIVISLPT